MLVLSYLAHFSGGWVGIWHQVPVLWIGTKGRNVLPAAPLRKYRTYKPSNAFVLPRLHWISQEVSGMLSAEWDAWPSRFHNVGKLASSVLEVILDVAQRIAHRKLCLPLSAALVSYKSSSILEIFDSMFHTSPIMEPQQQARWMQVSVENCSLSTSMILGGRSHAPALSAFRGLGMIFGFFVPHFSCIVGTGAYMIYCWHSEIIDKVVVLRIRWFLTLNDPISYVVV